MSNLLFWSCSGLGRRNSGHQGQTNSRKIRVQNRSEPFWDHSEPFWGLCDKHVLQQMPNVCLWKTGYLSHAEIQACPLRKVGKSEAAHFEDTDPNLSREHWQLPHSLPPHECVSEEHYIRYVTSIQFTNVTLTYVNIKSYHFVIWKNTRLSPIASLEGIKAPESWVSR